MTRRILLVQPKPPAPPWWPIDTSRGVERPSVATIDPRHPGSWSIGVVTDPGYTFSRADDRNGLVDALIEDWLDSYETYEIDDDHEVEVEWEFTVQDVVPGTVT